MHLLLILAIYFVSFLDKPEKTAPQLSDRAVAQRQKWHIATDQMDYPVSTLYCDSLRRMGIRIHHKSRWFNGATVEMNDSLADEVSRLSFVTAVEMTREDIEMTDVPKKCRRKYESASARQDGITGVIWTDEQLATYNLHPLHQAGYEGQGILMAVCDGSFHNADNLDCFRPKLELGHFDFTDDKDDFYGFTGSHGTYCLSVISGLTDEFRGAATRAEYYLMRSEELDTESPKEMDNLVAALEKADSLGVNVFSVSLGYAMFDNEQWTLPQSALDGRSTRASLAATIAARKGMLVCVAAGNEGVSPWHMISVPADADSILTVGAVGTDSLIGFFSGYGPSADGRVKPDVCAVGVQTTLIDPYNNVFTGNGTSFATPLLAGFAATLWSALPDENAMQIRERILRSADRYGQPDTDQYGYGIPNAWAAYQMAPTALITPASDTNCQKVLRDGQIYLLRNGKTYNMTGQIVR